MKQALVVGGARSGKYTALLLNKNGYKVTLTDINEVEYKAELENAKIKVVDKGHPDSLLDVKYDLVVKNPGIKYTVKFIKDLLDLGYKIYSEVDIALGFTKDYQVFAISGTNGKTTSTSLLYEMLKKQYQRAFVGGNIGIPVSEVVYKNGIDKAYLALELSSFQLDGIYDLKPKVTNLTNLKEDHLDYYADISQYYASKQRIYQNQDEEDYFLLNLDDDLVKANLVNLDASIITYAIDQKSDIEITNNQVIYKDIVLFDITQMKLVGKHNLYNAIVAALMAYLAKVDVEYIQAVISSFKGVEHRIEYVDTINDVTYYNDSKATNIESLIVALEAFDQKVILIAGGHDKNIAFDQLLNYQDQVKEVILFGETKYKLKDIFKDAYIVDDLKSAVDLSKKISLSNDIVLFSPACASFDQFKDYEERGNLFKTYVKNN